MRTSCLRLVLEACKKDVFGEMVGFWWEKGRGEPFSECRVRRARASRRAENETVRPVRARQFLFSFQPHARTLCTPEEVKEREVSTLGEIKWSF